MLVLVRRMSEWGSEIVMIISSRLLVSFKERCTMSNMQNIGRKYPRACGHWLHCSLSSFFAPRRERRNQRLSLIARWYVSRITATPIQTSQITPERDQRVHRDHSLHWTKVWSLQNKKWHEHIMYLLHQSEITNWVRVIQRCRVACCHWKGIVTSHDLPD